MSAVEIITNEEWGRRYGNDPRRSPEYVYNAAWLNWGGSGGPDVWFNLPDSALIHFTERDDDGNAWFRMRYTPDCDLEVVGLSDAEAKERIDAVAAAMPPLVVTQ